MTEITPELLNEIEQRARDGEVLCRITTLALVAHVREIEALARNSDDELYRDLWKASHANVARVAKRANELRAERDALKAKLEEAKAALEQAQSCILDETPEDMTHEEARADTLEKIRKVLCPRLTAEPAKGGEHEQAPRI